MINEFDQLAIQDDMKLLSEIKPEWALANPQPFLTSAQQNTVPALWGKLTLPVRSSDDVTSDGGGMVIIGVPIDTGVLTYITINGSPGGPV